MKTATGRSGPAMDQALVIAPWATMNGPCMMPMSAMQHQTTLAPCFAASGSAMAMATILDDNAAAYDSSAPAVVSAAGAGDPSFVPAFAEAGQEWNSTLVYECESTHTHHGEPPTYRCDNEPGLDGFFTNVSGSCVPKVCDGSHTGLTSVLEDNGQSSQMEVVDPPGPEQALGSTIVFNCKPGYFGTVTYSCTSDPTDDYYGV